MILKKSVSIALTAAILASFSTAVNAADGKEPAKREYVVSEFVQSVGRNNLVIKTDQADKILSAFKDSDDIDAEYREDIARAKSYALIDGYDDSTLRPRDNIRRIEAMVLFSRALPEDLEETSELIEFNDVPEWAKADIDRLTKAGLVYGYGDGRLGAEDNITVEQVKLLTDRSDEMLNTTPVGESFYGYINNKTFRNYSTADQAVIDPIHGAIIQVPNSWSAFQDRQTEITEKTQEALHKLLKGEMKFEDNTPEQRVYDMYYCYANKDEDADKDAEMFNAYRERLFNAKTPGEFVKEAIAIYNETGICVLFNVEPKTDTEEHIMYPYVTLTAPEFASKIMFDSKNAGNEKVYEDKFKAYAKLFDGKFSDRDVQEAINLQKSILANRDYYSEYLLARQMRAALSPDYDMETMQADMAAILEQHPLVKERLANEDENISGGVSVEIKLTPKEANVLSNDINIASLLEDAGYEAPKYLLLAKGDDAIFRNTRFTASNLNAFKLNAALKLAADLDYAPTEEERDIISIINAIASKSLLGIEYIEDEESGAEASSALDVLLDGQDEEMTEEEIMDSNILAISKPMQVDIGMIFARYEYTDEELEKVGDLFEELVEAYGELFGENKWMDEKTKKGAFAKLMNMIAIIGYPDNYGFAKITPREEGGTYAKNLIAIKLDEKDQMRQLFSDPEFVRTMMFDSPDTLNACYLPNFNIVNIFAGILGGAAYDKNGDRAGNLGALGMVVGHEIGHAFDASGAKFNEKGEFINWWSDECAEYFETIKQRFIDYYKNFDVAEGVVQDSEVTITENMADFAGMTAVMTILKGDKEAQKAALEAYARLWARLGDTASLTDSSVLSDVHSADNVRVDAVVASLPEFYEIYDIQEGDKMYIAPEDRLTLW